MSFISLEFWLFLIIVLILYWSASHRMQNLLLVLSGYGFCVMWDWRLAGLILLLTTIDFFSALKIDQIESRREKKFFLLISIFANSGILFTFKYFNFFAENFIKIAHAFGVSLQLDIAKILLPIGISFFTLQSLSYVIEVFRENRRPTKNFLNYALFVNFFPKLISGPLENPVTFISQIEQPRFLHASELRNSVTLIYWGFFKKIFIADNLGVMADYFLNSDAQLNGGLLFILMAAYGIQIYADFSAYIDIARGIAGLMGFRLTENFRTPLLSENIQDFWQRWHISLMDWFRKYIFLPIALTKNRFRGAMPYGAILVTFLLVGLWHGAGINYLLWGLFNGLLLTFFHLWRRNISKVKKSSSKNTNFLIRLFNNALTMIVLIISLIFFRSSSLGQIINSFYLLFYQFSFGSYELNIALKIFAYFLPLLAGEIFLRKTKDEISVFYKLPFLIRFSIFYLMLFLMIGFHSHAREFIYFQF